MGNTSTDEEVFAPESFSQFDLAKYLADPPPVVLRANGWLYAGGEHIFFGDSGVAKTWLSLACCKAEMAKGNHVVYFDEENGPDVIGERLLMLGLTEKQIAQYFHYYPFLSLTWRGLDLLNLDVTKPCISKLTLLW